MTTKKIDPANPKRRSVPVQQLFPYHRFEALLHTMRCIAQYEDALCELSHELKRANSLSVESINELRDILEKIPSHDYLVDLESVKAILAEPELSKYSSSKAVKSVKNSKSSAAAKKEFRRVSSK